MFSLSPTKHKKRLTALFSLHALLYKKTQCFFCVNHAVNRRNIIVWRHKSFFVASHFEKTLKKILCVTNQIHLLASQIEWKGAIVHLL